MEKVRQGGLQRPGFGSDSVSDSEWCWEDHVTHCDQVSSLLIHSDFSL